MAVTTTTTMHLGKVEVEEEEVVVGVRIAARCKNANFARKFASLRKFAL